MVQRWLRDHAADRHRVVDGSLLFADVSGFTALTERLADRGKVGAEDLTDILGAVTDDLLLAGTAEGGDLLKYGGDALLLLFDGPDHEARAVATAFEMQRRISVTRSTRAGRVRLSMSIGIASGPVDLLLLGDRHRELLVAGPVAEMVVHLEHDASSGQVAASTATVAAVAGLGTTPVDGGFLLEPTDRYQRGADGAWQPPAEIVLPDDLAMTGISELLRPRVLAGASGEHRQTCIGFVQIQDLPSIDDASAVAQLDEVVRAAQAASAETGVAFLSSDVDQGAAKIIVTAGAPTTSDGDVDRVLAFAHQLQSASLTLPIRIGVNAGRIFAVELGTPVRRFYTVLGDAVNLAARVMARAERGTVVATDDTLAMARSPFVATPLEPFLVKGKELPIHASVVEGAATEAPPSSGGGATAIIGRDRELAVIHDAVAAARDGRSAAIELVGGPGIGKSALVDAGLVDLEDLRVVRINAGVYAKGSPYFAMRAPLRDAIGVAVDASDADVLAAIVSVAGPGIEPWLPLVAPPFGVTVEDTPTTASIHDRFRRGRAHSLTVDVLGAALPGSGVTVVEDAQWLDESSRELLVYLLGAFAEAAWALIVTARTADDLLDVVRADEPVRIVLGPLADDDAMRLVVGGSDDRIAPATARALVDRGGGNPMFLRELADAVRAGVAVDELPDRVERLVASRIDALDHRDRDLLRAASVLGNRFDRATLETLATPLGLDVSAIDRLDAFISGDGHDRFRFQSALAQESAYEGLAYRRRRELHSRAARIFEERAAAGHDAAVELLALHHFRAEQWAEAWRWSVLAGERAAASEAAVEAMRFFEQAVSVSRHVAPPHSELRSVLRRLAMSAELASRLDTADRALHRACRLTTDPVELAALYERRGRVRDLEGRYDAAERWYRRGLALVADVAEVGRVVLDLRLGWAQALMRRRRLRRSADLFRQVIDDPAAATYPDALARGYTQLASVLNDLGDPEAVEWRDRALPIYEELGDLIGQIRALGNGAVDAYYDGDWDLAQDLYRRAADCALRAGDTQNQIVLEANWAEMLTDRGDHEAALDLLLDTLATARAARYGIGIALAHGYLGRTLTRLGRFDEAERHLSEARSRWEPVDEAMVVEIDLQEAERLLCLGDTASAVDAIERCRRTVATIQGLGWLGATLDRLDGLAAAQQRRWDDALELLASARSQAAGSSMVAELWAVAAMVGVLRLCGRDDEAAALDDEVRALWDRLQVTALPDGPLVAARS